MKHDLGVTTLHFRKPMAGICVVWFTSDEETKIREAIYEIEAERSQFLWNVNSS